jgi:TonB family protein
MVAVVVEPEPTPPAQSEPDAVPVPVLSNRRSSRRRTLYASAGLAAAALVVSALAFRSNAGSDSTDEVQPIEVATAATTDGSTTLDIAAMGADSARSRATLQLLAANTATGSRAPESVTPVETPSMPAAPKRLTMVPLPTIAAGNVDSLVRASTKTGREPLTDQIGSAGGLRISPIGDDVSGKPPVLIGPAPVPYFPEALRSQRTEGEVVVRFRVDERGRVDVSSMKVVKSDHELFTLAVRNVLPRFHFEPARSAAPESKPRSEWVDFRAEFALKS